MFEENFESKNLVEEALNKGFYVTEENLRSLGASKEYIRTYHLRKNLIKTVRCVSMLCLSISFTIYDYNTLYKRHQMKKSYHRLSKARRVLCETALLLKQKTINNDDLSEDDFTYYNNILKEFSLYSTDEMQEKINIKRITNNMKNLYKKLA